MLFKIINGTKAFINRHGYGPALFEDEDLVVFNYELTDEWASVTLVGQDLTIEIPLEFIEAVDVDFVAEG